MEQGVLPEADPLDGSQTGTALGMNLSVWHWYRRRGTHGIDEIAKFFVGRQLAVLGRRTGDC